MAGYHDINKMNPWAQLGKQFIRALITDKKQKRLHAYIKDRSRAKMIRSVCQDKAGQLRDLSHACLKHLSPVTAPLALIAPFQYSGGAELSRLFDGHPQILALPPERMIGRTLKTFRNDISQNESPQQWLESVFEELHPWTRSNDDGQGKKLLAGSPYVFLPHLQRLLFLKALQEKEVTARNLFNAYLSSCFGAWMNYQYIGPDKKFVTTFAPGVVTSSAAMDSFFKTYPDGKVIFLIRSPEDWYRHAARNEPDAYMDLPAALNRWKEYANNAKEAKSRFKDRVCLIEFKDLVTKTKPVMRYLADFLEIEYHDILLTQTFNRVPVSPLKVSGIGAWFAMDGEMARFDLSTEQVELISEMTTEVQQSVLHATASI